jgi:hypothetical protein
LSRVGGSSNRPAVGSLPFRSPAVRTRATNASGETTTAQAAITPICLSPAGRPRTTTPRCCSCSRSFRWTSNHGRRNARSSVPPFVGRPDCDGPNRFRNRTLPTRTFQDDRVTGATPNRRDSGGSGPSEGRTGLDPANTRFRGPIRSAYGQRLAHVPIEEVSTELAGAGRLPGERRDPFDRMLAAQAQIEDLPIVSNDPVFTGFGLERIW